MTNSVVQNYRGELVTWPRLFEVLEDYLDGRRKYSFGVSKKGNISCMYRQNSTPECGVTCIAGAFIADDDYSPDIEGTGVVYAVLKDKIHLSEDVDLGIVVIFQLIHDNLADRLYYDAKYELERLDVPQEYQATKEQLLEKIRRLNSD
jgi:hypothetical protein